MLICKSIPEGAGQFAFESFLCDVTVLKRNPTLRSPARLRQLLRRDVLIWHKNTNPLPILLN